MCKSRYIGKNMYIEEFLTLVETSLNHVPQVEDYLQREKSNDNSKKSTFKPSKFKKQIKQSLMATWDDLGSESGSDKEEANEDAKIAVGLVATTVGTKCV